MASLAQSGPKPDPSDILTETYGSVPDLFRAQSALPAGVEAEAGLIDAIVLHGPDLAEKRAILAAVATVHGDSYLSALHQTRGTSEISPSLVKLVGKLARHGPCVSKHDVDSLREAGFSDRKILETIATVALGNMLCLLSQALTPSPGLGVKAETTPALSAEDIRWNADFGPYLNSETGIRDDLASILRDQYGFVPGVFRSQVLWPELVAAQSKALDLLVVGDERLTQIQKESILLAVSVANLNTYGVALHSQILSVLGSPIEAIDSILHGRENSPMGGPDQVLLTEISQLIDLGHGNQASFDHQALSNAGFSQAQVLEAIVVAGLGHFLDTLAFGLGVPPDFPPRRLFTEKDLYPPEEPIRPTSDVIVRHDPDGDLVTRVRGGEVNAFEELVRRHTRRVFGTLNGILGNHEEARDATQDVFIKAFEHIGQFEGRAKFSTWVTSIAVNAGTEILRRRKDVVPLEHVEDEDFRPRRVMAWAEDPESVFAVSEVNSLVRDAVLRLPHKYRVAVLLRDINQLSTDETAEALGISVPALKARVLRGRLMLRESLAVHFASAGNADA